MIAVRRGRQQHERRWNLIVLLDDAIDGRRATGDYLGHPHVAFVVMGLSNTMCSEEIGLRLVLGKLLWVELRDAQPHTAQIRLVRELLRHAVEAQLLRTDHVGAPQVVADERLVLALHSREFRRDDSHLVGACFMLANEHIVPLLHVVAS